MFVDFICENKECEKFQEKEERNISHSEIENQKCEVCGEPLKRIWNTNASIRTSDGFKS